MSKHKMHFEVIEQAPSESDPDGWSYILCRRDSVESCTTNKDLVTCRICKRTLIRWGWIE